MSAKTALHKYLEKHAGLNKKGKRHGKNKRPEKEVECEVLEWCKEKGIEISVVESKAVYSARAGRYLRGQTSAGFSDLVGTTTNGRACFIELKAKGRRGTIRHSQKDFLIIRIRKGAFGACVDSVGYLDSVYSAWLELISKGNEKDAIDFLIKELPLTKIDKIDNEIPW